MNDIQFKTDTSEVQQMLTCFKNSDWLRAERNMLKIAGRKVQKYYKDRMKTMLPNATKRSSKYSDRLIDAIRMTKVKTNTDEISLKVHTMGTRKPNSGTFRARFFNNSTETPRQRKKLIDALGRTYKGTNTGILKQVNYFDEYQNQNVMNDLNNELQKQIEKINNKKYLGQ